MQFLIMLVLMVVMDFLRPVPAPPRRPGLNEFQVTTAEQDRRIPVFWGSPWLKGPNLVWYGDLRMTKITKKVKGMFKSKKQTIGYRYYLGFHLVFGYGRGDVSLLKINAGTDEVWSGDLASGRGKVDKPSIWGGDEEGGGIAGDFDWLPGTPTQGQNDYLVRNLGGKVPGYRQVCSVVWRQGYVGNSTMIRQWTVKVRRIPQGLQSGYANIGGQANPAEILYELLTNKDWGLGLDDPDIDLESFRLAAQTLHAEGLGCSLVWDQAMAIEGMIKEVDRHADSVTYQNASTGKWTLKLIRADYQLDQLPRVTPSNATLTSFVRPTADELVNEVKVIYSSDEFDGKSVPVQVKDEAGYWNRNNQKVSSELSYPGFTTKTAALLAATRDLRTLSYPIARVQLVVNRSLHQLGPMSRFVLDWPPEGISNMPMIVMEKDIGTLSDGKITLTAVQDVFGIGNALYTETQGSAWVKPNTSALAPQVYRMEFSPYWVMLADPDIADPESAVPLLMLESPSPAHRGFDLKYTDPGLAGVMVDAEEAEPFTPTATLQFDYLETVGVDTSGTLIFSGLTSAEDIEDSDVSSIRQLGDGLAVIGNEWLAISELSRRADGSWAATKVYRGLLDTTISRHQAGAKVWFIGMGVGRTPTALHPFAAGSYSAKVMPKAIGGVLDESLAPTLSISSDAQGNNARPLYDYPVRDLALNGVKTPTKLSSSVQSLSVTWNHSNKVEEKAIKFHGDAESSKPAGVHYLVSAFNDSGTRIGVSGPVYGSNWTFAAADLAGGIPRAGFVQVETVNGVGKSRPAVLWFGLEVDYAATQDEAPQRLLAEAGPWTLIRMSD